MMVDEDDRRLPAVLGEIGGKPAQLGGIEQAGRLSWLLRVEDDEVIAAVVEAVVLRRVRRRRLRAQHPVEGHAVVVIADEEMGRTRQRGQDVGEQSVRRLVLLRGEGPATIEEVGAREIPAEDRKCRSGLEGAYEIGRAS